MQNIIISKQIKVLWTWKLATDRYIKSEIYSEDTLKNNLNKTLKFDLIKKLKSAHFNNAVCHKY